MDGACEAFEQDRLLAFPSPAQNLCAERWRKFGRGSGNVRKIGSVVRPSTWSAEILPSFLSRGKYLELDACAKELKDGGRRAGRWILGGTGR